MVFSGLLFPSGLPCCVLELVTNGRIFDRQVSFTAWDSVKVIA